MGDSDEEGNSRSFPAHMDGGPPAESDAASLSPTRMFRLEADLSLEEFKLLYKVLWAAQMKADSIAVMALLKDTDGISREVTMETAEIMRAGRTFANVLRKFGFTPRAARDFVGRVRDGGPAGQDHEEDEGEMAGGRGKGAGISFRDLPPPSAGARRLAPPAPPGGQGSGDERIST